MVNMWRDVVKVFKVIDRVKNKIFGRKYLDFFWFNHGRERESKR